MKDLYACKNSQYNILVNRKFLEFTQKSRRFSLLASSNLSFRRLLYFKNVDLIVILATETFRLNLLLLVLVASPPKNLKGFMWVLTVRILKIFFRSATLFIYLFIQSFALEGTPQHQRTRKKTITIR